MKSTETDTQNVDFGKEDGKLICRFQNFLKATNSLKRKQMKQLFMGDYQVLQWGWKDGKESDSGLRKFSNREPGKKGETCRPEIESQQKKLTISRFIHGIVFLPRCINFIYFILKGQQKTSLKLFRHPTRPSSRKSGFSQTQTRRMY